MFIPIIYKARLLFPGSYYDLFQIHTVQKQRIRELSSKSTKAVSVRKKVTSKK
jgi:hypothetical protein